jgi:GcrA cell cycle regulator
MSWTDERIALLKRMWKEGKSAADIAKALAKGVTRNAVIGKAHRMGLSGRPSPIKKPPSAPKKEAPRKEVLKAAPATKKAAPPVTVSGVKHNPLLREVAEPRKFEKEPIPPGGGVALIDLTERMCKWPIGDPREDDFTFCGRNIRQGTPYCPDHAGMAYQSSSRTRAAAAEEKEVKEVATADTDDDDEVVAVT